jgi:nucleotide-binding universal stress UspA family protein
MKTILVPTDFSDNAANALDYALALARHTPGRIILFHNSDIPLTYSGTNLFSAGDLALGTDPLLPAAAMTNPELEKIYQEKLQQLAHQVRQQTGDSLAITSQYHWGSLTDNLNDIIRKEKVDLVVMGTKGATSFLDRLIGTTTASVLKEAHQAVLAIPTEARFKIPQKIAFAADLENDEQIYLSQVLAFARPFGAGITLVHVNREYQEDIASQQKRLADIRRQFPEQPLPLFTLEDKQVALGLETFIRENQADLIAVGIHERSFLEYLFHSSVTEQLAYHTSIPLLALPEKPYYLSS